MRKDLLARIVFTLTYHGIDVRQARKIAHTLLSGRHTFCNLITTYGYKYDYTAGKYCTYSAEQPINVYHLRYIAYVMKAPSFLSSSQVCKAIRNHKSIPN